MFKVRITAINPSTPPRPYGGTSSLIPNELAIGGDRPIDVTITIDSAKPDKYGKTTYGGADSSLISQWLPNQHGMYGHRVGDEANPLDVSAALSAATWIEWEILEGEEILDMPRQKLPPGAVW
jgi:hypothetical protein